MEYSDYKKLVLSDLYRITENTKLTSLIKQILIGESYKYIFWMRTCQYTNNHPILRYTIYPFARVLLNHLKFKLGISIPYVTKIDTGFYIGHYGGIIINHNITIGKNCNISQGVTMGQANRGKNKGYPVIGENVYIGPGAKIIGAITIGNNVAIGANCVVTKDIPDNAVVIGIPGEVISYNGSTGYVNRTDYDNQIN